MNGKRERRDGNRTPVHHGGSSFKKPPTAVGEVKGASPTKWARLASLSSAASENIAGKHRTFKEKLQAGFPGGTVRTSSRTMIIQGGLKNQLFLYYRY